MKTHLLANKIGLEHPSVKRVLEIAEEITNKNKVLNVETLYNLAKKTLKVPRSGLMSIIQFLINKKILVEGSKFTKKSVLSNQYRRNIYNYIKRFPGVHFSILRKRALNNELDNIASSGQLVWHLEMLLKFNYIKQTKIGNYTIFFPIEMDEKVGKLFFILRDEINRKILELLIKHESIKKSNIYKIVNEKREAVYYHIKSLNNYNIISSMKDSDKEICLNHKVKEDLIEILRYLKDNLLKISKK